MRSIYTIDGMPYYKKGGKYRKKYQLGDLVQSGIENDTFNSVANTTGMYLSGLNKRDQAPAYGRRSEKATNEYRNTAIQEGLGTALSIAGQFDPTIKMIDSAYKISKGVGDAIAQRDQYGISKSRFGEAASSVLDPFGWVQRSVNTGKKHGFGEGLKNFVTLGDSGRDLAKQDLAKAKRQDLLDEASLRQGKTQGSYKNNSIFAQKGGIIRPKLNTSGEPNVEVEDGEIILGNPNNMTLYGQAGSSMRSPYAIKVHGDKHEQDTDKDGMEGIPMKVDEGTYVASNYLGVDGKKAKNGKTVAKAIEPYVKNLSKAQEDPQNAYKNNPQYIAHHKMEINRIINEAEQNKLKQEVYKTFKESNKVKELNQEYMYRNNFNRK